eukprot:gene10443-biopygen2588
MKVSYAYEGFMRLPRRIILNYSARSTLEYVGVCWGTLEFTEFVEYAGMRWSILEYPGVPWSTMQYGGVRGVRGVRWSMQECVGVSWSTPEYCGVRGLSA